MGLLSKLLMGPVTAPFNGTLWVAGKIAEAAEAERNDKGTLRAALAEAERQLLDGTLSEEDYDAIEDDLLHRLRDAS
jgi:hypothetical protein